MKVRLSVNSEVVIWARERAGLDQTEAAKTLGWSLERLVAVEGGTEKPTEPQLEKLAALYKRPMSVFFLPSRPEDPPLPTDFRRLAGAPAVYSSRLRLVSRRASRVQRLTAEFESSLGVKRPKLSQTGSTRDDPEALAERIRSLLPVRSQEQRAFANNPNVALKRWREAVESLGVMVLQLRIRPEDARGFSMAGEVPTIVLSIHDSPYARCFTLFHELAHLVTRTPGVCSPDPARVAHVPAVEVFCNRVAAAVLVPKRELLSAARDVQITAGVDPQDVVIEGLGRKVFGVSRLVVLRRLFTVGLMARTHFRDRMQRWVAPLLDEDDDESEEDDKEIRISSFQWASWELSPRFMSAVLDVHGRGIITESDACDYLSVRLHHLDRLQNFLLEASG